MLAKLNCKTGYIPRDAEHLYASFHPAPDTARGRVLIFTPFGEERKCSYRLLAETAHELAAAGYDVLRFDLSGTGESTGHHADATIDGWQADIAAAAKALGQESDGAEFWLLGARFGANLALKTELEDVAGMVLWEPVLSGEAYIEEMIRRKQIKEMMGGGQASSYGDELAARWTKGDSVDFDGFAVGAELKKGMMRFVLRDALEACDVGRLLLCHVGGARSLTGPWAKLEDQFEAETRTIMCVRQKPFWGLLDYEESRELKDETISFLTEN